MARRDTLSRRTLGRAVGVALGTGISTGAAWYFRGKLLKAAARAAPGMTFRALTGAGRRVPRAVKRTLAPTGRIAARYFPTSLRLPDGR